MSDTPKPDIVTKNDTRIRFSEAQENGFFFTVERNVGQVSFDNRPDAFLFFDVPEGGWFLTRDEAVELWQWLGTCVGRTGSRVEQM